MFPTPQSSHSWKSFWQSLLEPTVSAAFHILTIPFLLLSLAPHMWSVMPPLPEVRLHSAWTCLPTQRQTRRAEKESGIHGSQDTAHFWLNHVIIILYMLKKATETENFLSVIKKLTNGSGSPSPAQSSIWGLPSTVLRSLLLVSYYYSLYFLSFLRMIMILGEMLTGIFFPSMLYSFIYWVCARFQMLLLTLTYNLLIFTNDKTEAKALDSKY